MKSTNSLSPNASESLCVSSRLAMRRALIGIGLAALSSVLLTVSFPPYGLWPLVFVGLVPMIVAQHRVMPERLSSLAYAIGIGGFFAGYFGSMFAHSPWFMRALPLFIALVAGIIGSRDRSFHARTGYRWLIAHGVAVWVGIEMIRGLIPVFGTWGFAAYALYGQPWLIQPVSLFGVYGMSVIVLVVNYTLGLCALVLMDRFAPLDSRSRLKANRDVSRQVWASVFMVLGWIVLSAGMMNLHVETESTVRVAAIHPAFRAQTSKGVEELSRLTRQAASEGAQLVVWNEGALPFDPKKQFTGELQSLAADTGAHLVIGYVEQRDTGLRNEAVILTPEGEFLGPYGKDHPVAWSGETSVTRGPHRSYETAVGSLGMMICYDADFTDTARRVAADGAQLIAIPSHDWSAIASKHYTHVVFRAVENRVAAVKADIGYDSVIVDPYGRIVSRAVTPTPESEVVIGDVSLATGRTLASYLGDWVGWLAIAAMVGFAAIDRFRALASR